MKKLSIVLTICILGIVSFSANAQFFNSSHVPQQVKNAFRANYPGAKHTKWDKRDAGFQATFDLHRSQIVTLYDHSGRMLAEVMGINKVNLPRRARRQLHDNYTSFAIETAVRIKSPNGMVTYETYIGGPEEAYDLVFNTQGYLLSVIPMEVPQVAETE